MGIGDVMFIFMQFSVFDLMAQWEYAGIFDLVLPFLLIFAVLFGVLMSTNILGGHKGVNLVISLTIALMALRLEFVSFFFAELFPRFGVGLASIIVIVMLAALFIPKEHAKGWFIGFGIAGAVIGIIVLIFTFNQFYWFDSFFWQDYWGIIVGGIILVIVIIAIFVTGGPKSEPSKSFTLGPFRENLHKN